MQQQDVKLRRTAAAAMMVVKRKNIVKMLGMTAGLAIKKTVSP
jgi:hypothetical protein